MVEKNQNLEKFQNLKAQISALDLKKKDTDSNKKFLVLNKTKILNILS
jgi:hypothetical protein